MKTEEELIYLAETALEDKDAQSAMDELRDRFDKTYMWCLECDGAVVKSSECCLNRLENDKSITD